MSKYKFGTKSREKLDQSHTDLVALAEMVIEIMDFSVIEGHRGQRRQNSLFKVGRSRVKWPNSKHNALPSNAIDVAPYPIDWNDKKRFAMLMGAFKMAAHLKGIWIRLGGDWNGDNLFNEQFLDMPHIERVGE